MVCIKVTIWTSLLITQISLIYFYILCLVKIIDFETGLSNPIDMCEYLNSLIKYMVGLAISNFLIPILDFSYGYVISLLNIIPLLIFEYFRFKRNKIFNFYSFVREITYIKGYILIFLILGSISFMYGIVLFFLTIFGK